MTVEVTLTPKRTGLALTFPSTTSTTTLSPDPPTTLATYAFPPSPDPLRPLLLTLRTLWWDAQPAPLLAITVEEDDDNADALASLLDPEGGEEENEHGPLVRLSIWLEPPAFTTRLNVFTDLTDNLGARPLPPPPSSRITTALTLIKRITDPTSTWHRYLLGEHIIYTPPPPVSIVAPTTEGGRDRDSLSASTSASASAPKKKKQPRRRRSTVHPRRPPKATGTRRVLPSPDDDDVVVVMPDGGSCPDVIKDDGDDVEVWVEPEQSKGVEEREPPTDPGNETEEEVGDGATTEATPASRARGLRDTVLELIRPDGWTALAEEPPGMKVSNLRVLALTLQA